MQTQYYLFEKGKVPALLIRFRSGEKTSDLENNLENLALIRRMEIKRLRKIRRIFTSRNSLPLIQMLEKASG